MLSSTHKVEKLLININKLYLKLYIKLYILIYYNTIHNERTFSVLVTSRGGGDIGLFFTRNDKNGRRFKL